MTKTGTPSGVPELRFAPIDYELVSIPDSLMTQKPIPLSREFMPAASQQRASRSQMCTHAGKPMSQNLGDKVENYKILAIGDSYMPADIFAAPFARAGLNIDVATMTIAQPTWDVSSIKEFEGDPAETADL